MSGCAFVHRIWEFSPAVDGGCAEELKSGGDLLATMSIYGMRFARYAGALAWKNRRVELVLNLDEWIVVLALDDTSYYICPQEEPDRFL